MTKLPCNGKMRNGPEKRYARCTKCGAIDYELNEGDPCRNNRPIKMPPPFEGCTVHPHGRTMEIRNQLGHPIAWLSLEAFRGMLENAKPPCARLTD